MIGRRGFITGLVSLAAAPAIVRSGSLMPIKAIIEPAIRYRAISMDEMVELMRGGFGVSGAFSDAFVSCTVAIDQNGLRHIPLQEFYR
jgi:hypothetical protein